MSINNLRERILIQSCIRKFDRLGGFVNTWADCGEFWAEIVPTRNQNLETNHYKIRWRSNLKIPKNGRILWGERILRIITPVLIDEKKRWASVIAKLEGDSDE